MNNFSFQNSLSHLTTNMIQQFLDELTFRESFGLYPLLCFESLIQRLATQVSSNDAQNQKNKISVKKAENV